MPNRPEIIESAGNIAREIGSRAKNKLTNETPEVIGLTLVGATTFITMYELLVVSGMEPGIAAITAGGQSGAASVLVDTIIHQIRD